MRCQRCDHRLLIEHDDVGPCRHCPACGTYEYIQVLRVPMTQWVEEVVHHDESEHYADTGCRLSPTCLACPLPACVYTLPAAVIAGFIRRSYWLELLEYWDSCVADGMSVKEATETTAQQFNVTTRSVFRVRAGRDELMRERGLAV
jgi:hypothetical protein